LSYVLGECDKNLFARNGETNFVEAAGNGDLNSLACLLDESFDDIIDQEGNLNPKRFATIG
jgi:hypothetical protein